MMNQSGFFSTAPFQVPFSCYNFGTAMGYLQYPENKQPNFYPDVTKPSFSIDSLLNRKCSRERTVDVRDSGQEDGPAFYQGGKSILGTQRFRPYYCPHSVSLEQESSVIATPSTKENERGESADKKEWLRLKPKRMRTIFTVEQLERMEREFDRQQYMVGADRFFLANELGLTETQVKVWFQNRRIKWRKNILEKQHRQLSGMTAEEF